MAKHRKERVPFYRDLPPGIGTALGFIFAAYCGWIIVVVVG